MKVEFSQIDQNFDKMDKAIKLNNLKTHAFVAMWSPNRANLWNIFYLIEMQSKHHENINYMMMSCPNMSLFLFHVMNIWWHNYNTSLPLDYFGGSSFQMVGLKKNYVFLLQCNFIVSFCNFTFFFSNVLQLFSNFTHFITFVTFCTKFHLD